MAPERPQYEKLLRSLDANRRTLAPAPGDIGPRIREGRLSRGLTQTQFCRLLNHALQERGGRTRWNHESPLSRLERARDDAPRLTDLEVELVAGLLGVHPRSLLGLDERERIVHWKMLSEPGCGHELAQYMKDVPFETSEVLSWGEHLGALATGELMRRSNAALYSRGVPGLAPECRALVTRNHDDLGSAIRSEFVEATQARRGRFVHMIFESDLLAIAHGDGQDSGFVLHARHCLAGLSGALADRVRGLDLIVLRDDGELRRKMRFADSLLCVEGRFAIWRDHLGGVSTTVAGDIVRAKRQLLEQLRRHALHATITARADFLCRLVAAARESQLDFRALLGSRRPFDVEPRPSTTA